MGIWLHFLLSTALAAPAPGGVEEVWVKATDSADRAVLAALPLGFAEGMVDGWLKMHAEPGGLVALDRAGLRWVHAARTLLPPAAYHSPEEMVTALEELAAAHPERVQLIDLGWSEEGRPIVGLRISKTSTPTSQWRIAGAHHGDETSSAEVTLSAATELASSSDPLLDELLEEGAVWFIPHINPDGVAAMSRYNANNVDLNRNYGYEWSPTEFRSGSSAFSEPETRNLRALSAWIPFGSGLSLHSGATNLGWVWNFTTDPSPDAFLAEALAEAYEEGCDQGGFYITNGAEWYITYGDTTDWAYGRHGTLDYTLEVSFQKSPVASQLEAVLAAHTPPVLQFLQWPWQVRGRVVDAGTGQGIPAVVTMGEGGWPVQTGPSGRFARPTGSEDVSLVITAPGYTSHSLVVDTALDEVLRIELVASTILDARPQPAYLTRSGDGTFTLEVDTESLVLSRPGEVPLPATWTGTAWSVDIDELSPGPWDLTTDAGVVPRGIFVGELDDAVVVEHIAMDGLDRLVLTGGDFGRGTRVSGIWGPERAYTPLTILEQTTDRLVIDATDVVTAPFPADLVILSNGRQLALVDINGEEHDTGGRTEDTGSGEPETGEPADTALDEGDTGPKFEEPDGEGKLTTCSCATPAGYPAPWLLVSLPLWFSRRRRRL